MHAFAMTAGSTLGLNLLYIIMSVTFQVFFSGSSCLVWDSEAAELTHGMNVIPALSPFPLVCFVSAQGMCSRVSDMSSKIRSI